MIAFLTLVSASSLGIHVRLWTQTYRRNCWHSISFLGAGQMVGLSFILMVREGSAQGSCAVALPLGHTQSRALGRRGRCAGRGGERGHVGWAVHTARLGGSRPGLPPPTLSPEVRTGQQACPGN